MKTGKWRASAQRIALILGVVAGYAISSTTAQAAVIYTTSGDLVTGIGDQLNSLFDKISLGPYESMFVAPETKDLNPLTFVIGFNSNTPATVDGHMTETITIGATTEPVTIPFVATISASGDFAISSFDAFCCWRISVRDLAAHVCRCRQRVFFGDAVSRGEYFGGCCPGARRLDADARGHRRDWPRLAPRARRAFFKAGSGGVRRNYQSLALSQSSGSRQTGLEVRTGMFFATPDSPQHPDNIGDSGRARTCDLPLRRRLLYPAELRSRNNQAGRVSCNASM